MKRIMEIYIVYVYIRNILKAVAKFNIKQLSPIQFKSDFKSELSFWLKKLKSVEQFTGILNDVMWHWKINLNLENIFK